MRTGWHWRGRAKEEEIGVMSRYYDAELTRPSAGMVAGARAAGVDGRKPRRGSHSAACC